MKNYAALGETPAVPGRARLISFSCAMGAPQAHESLSREWAEGFGVRQLAAALQRFKAVPRHRSPKRFAHGPATVIFHVGAPPAHEACSVTRKTHRWQGCENPTAMEQSSQRKKT